MDTETRSLTVVGGMDRASEQVWDLVRASMAPNTRRSYATALRRLEGWLAGRPLDDLALAEYLASMAGDGLSAASATTALAAVRLRAKLQETPSPVGPMTDRAYRGYLRVGPRGRSARGQAVALTRDQIEAMADGCVDPRERALVLVMFQACLRRSEAAALRWGDVEPAARPGAYRIHVRRSKTNQEGRLDEVRLVKDRAAEALDAIRPILGGPEASVFGMSGWSIGQRWKAAAERIGVHSTSHSARVSYASILTTLGASTHEIMKGGAWRTERMVAHYAAGVEVEEGATARYL